MDVVIKMKNTRKQYDFSQIALTGIVRYVKQFYDFIIDPAIVHIITEVKYEKILDNTDKYINILYTSDVSINIKKDVEYTAEDFFKFINSQIPKDKRLAVHADFIKNVKAYNASNEDFIRTFFEEKVINLPQRCMFIYGDIIKPCIINDKTARVLCVNPIVKQKLNDDINEVSIKNIQYHEVEKKCFNEISILLTNEFGEQINFRDGTNYTSLVLHFSKTI